MEQFHPDVSTSLHQRNGGHMSSVGPVPNGTSNMSKLEAMSPYFGVPNKQVVDQPYSWWDSENYDLPDALKGKCTYVLNILITAILQSDMWPVTEMLPYRKSEDSLEVHWDIWTFNDSLLDRTPEQTTSRMTTNNSAGFKAYLVRRGKAFMLEHGFWMTPKGQMNWAMNIVQIVNATNETACFGASHAILTAPPYIDVSDRHRSHHDRTVDDINSIIRQQTDAFACLQKTVRAYDRVMGNAISTFENRNGHRPNYAVLPQTARALLTERPEETAFWYNGKGVTNRDITKDNRLTVRMSRGYRVGEHQPNHDPHYEIVCIGSVTISNMDAVSNVPIASYRTQQRNLRIFSMGVGDYYTIEFHWALKNMGLYKVFGDARSEWSWIGEAFLAKYHSWGRLADASGMKQMIVDKILLLDDDRWSDFMEYFSANFVGVLPPITEETTTLIVPDDQPTTSGAVVVRVPRTENYHRFASFWRHVTPLPPSDAVFDFKGNMCIPGITSTIGSGKPVDFVFDPVDGAFPCRVASTYLTLFDIPFADGRLPRVTSGEMTTGASRMHAGRILVCIAVSAFVGMLDRFNRDTMISAEKEDVVSARFVKQFHQWLDETSGRWSMTTTSSETLSSLFAPGASFVRDIQLSRMRRLPCQSRLVTPDEFLTIFGFIQTICTDVEEEHVAAFHAANKVLLASHTKPGGVQPSARARAAYQPGWEHDERMTRLGLHYQAFQATETKRKSTEAIGKVKKLIDTKLVEMSGASIPAGPAGKKDFLAGFSTRWGALSHLFEQLWLLTTDAVTAGVRQADSPIHRARTLEWLTVVGVLASRLRGPYYAREFVVKMIEIASSSDEPRGKDIVFSNLSNESLTPVHRDHVDTALREFCVGSDAAFEDNIAFRSLIEPSTLAAATDAYGVHSTADSAMTPLVSVVDEIKGLRRVTPAADETEYDRLAALPALSNGKIDYNATVPDWDHFLSLVETTQSYRNIAAAEEPLIRILSSRAFPPAGCFETFYKLIVVRMMMSIVDDRGRLLGDSHDPSQFTVKFVRLCVIDALGDKVGTPNETPIGDEFQPVTIERIQEVLILTVSRLLNMRADSNALLMSVLKVLDIDSDHLAEKVLASMTFEPKTTGAVTPSTKTAPTKSHARRVFPRMRSQEVGKLLDAVPLRTNRWLSYSLHNDLHVPLGYYAFRLHQQYDMGTGVVMDAYGQAGYTYFGHADFQLGDDIGKKVHIAHFTLYLKAVVQFNKLIVYMRYIVCRGYHGGAGTRAWDPLDEDDISEFRQGNMSKDIIFAPALANIKMEHTVMDVTGRFPADMQASEAANASTHYESCDLIRKIWNIHHPPVRGVAVAQQQTPAGRLNIKPRFQTIALQEASRVWNHTAGDYTTEIADMTHWGPTVTAQSAAVRRGEGGYIERPNTIGLGI
jgi:hypothetical protein